MQSTRTGLFSLLSIILLASLATAEPSEEADHQFRLAMVNYERQVEGFKDYWSTGLDDHYPIGGCHAAIKTAQAAGVTVSAEHQKMCDEFRTYHLLAEGEKAAGEAKDWLRFLANIDMATNHEENGAKMAASAKKCVSEIERLAAAGMPMDVVVRIANTDPVELPMSQVKDKICAPLAKAAGSFAKDVGTARTERTEAIAKPYKAAGITGERLNLLVDHIDYAMYGVGGNQLRTPQQLKNAKVIFELLGPGTDGLYTLRRYQFSGDKIVSTSSRDFWVRPGAKFYK